MSWDKTILTVQYFDTGDDPIDTDDKGPEIKVGFLSW